MVTGTATDTPSAVANDGHPVPVIADDARALAVAQAYADQIRPGAIERDATWRLPVEELQLLARTGLLGVTVPRQYGGAEISCETLTEIFRVISVADPSIGQVPQNHFAFVQAIAESGSPDQKRFFFAEFLNGARLGNALSERGGRTPLDFKTRLEPDPAGGFRLNGDKYYCTGALTAQWVPVFVLDDQQRTLIVYVPRDAPGLSASHDWSAMGQRATVSGTVRLRQVHVEEKWIVPHWEPFERPQVLGAFGQIMHAAVEVGIARAAIEDAASFVRTRTRAWFESPHEQAGQDPVILHTFGRLASQVHAAEALLAEAARTVDRARRHLDADSAAAASLAVAEAKAFGSETAVKVASEVFDLTGTSSTQTELGLDRHWRNARTHSLHDPVRWKYIHAGNFVVNATPPPNHPLI